MRATRSLEVIGDAPVSLVSVAGRVVCKTYTYEVQPVTLGPRVRLRRKPHRRDQENRLWMQIAGGQRQFHGGKFGRRTAGGRLWKLDAFCLVLGG